MVIILILEHGQLESVLIFKIIYYEESYIYFYYCKFFLISCGEDFLDRAPISNMNEKTL